MASHNLYENTLYKGQSEWDAFVKNKGKVAEALAINFFGTVGLLNSLTSAGYELLIQHLRREGKVRINKIDETNHDMSIAVKAASEAGMFISSSTVNEITRFLAKLRTGQVKEVDSKIIAGWMNKLKPEFFRNISNVKTRRAFMEFASDGGNTIDISLLSRTIRDNRVHFDHLGEFWILAKNKKMVVRDIKPATATVQTPSITNTATQSSTVSPVNSDPKTDGSSSGSFDINKTNDPAPTTTVAPKNNTSTIKKDKMDASQLADVISSFILDKIGLKNVDTSKFSQYDDDELENLKESVNALSDAGDILYKAFDASNYTLDILKLRKDVQNALGGESGINKIRNIMGKETFTITLRTFSLKEKAGDFNSTYDAFKDLCIGDPNKNRLLSKNIETTYDAFLSANDSRIAVRCDPTSIARYINEYLEGELPKHLKNLITNKTFSTWSEPRMSAVMVAAMVHYARLKDMDLPFKKEPSDFNELRNFINIVSNRYETTNTIFYGGKITPEMRKTLYWYNEKFVSVVSKMDSKNILSVAFSVNEDMFEYFKPLIKENVEEIFLRGTVPFNLTGKIFKDMEMFAEISDKVGVKEILNADYEERDAKSRMLYSVFRKGLDKDLTREEIKGFAKNAVGVHQESDGRYDAQSRFNRVTNLLRETDDTNNISIIMEVMDELFASDIKKSKSVITNDPASFRNIINVLGKENVVDYIRLLKKHNITELFDTNAYKSIRRRDVKSEFVQVLSNILKDTFDTDVEDYMSDIVDNLEGNLVNRLRGSLIGMEQIKEELERSPIKLYENIDAKRLRQILAYNDIDAEKIGASKLRRIKNEPLSVYIKRASKELGDSTALEPIMATIDETADVKGISRTLNDNYHAGKHGNIYPRVEKVFNSTLEYPEFEEFRNNAPDGDKTVIPAFHGSNGVATAMVLRYGYRVIKSSDSSVVGRMLGDGIYFSNKIDKVSQYIGTRYARSEGVTGYIFDIDVNLGRRPKDHEKAGVDGVRMNIRSPEWVVREPRAQIRVKKVYQVTTNRKETLDQWLNEGKSTAKGFKNFLKEENENMIGETLTFIFRDGMIPIYNPKTMELEYKDFEDVKESELMGGFIEPSAQGPMLVFTDGLVQETELYDERFGSMMTKEAYNACLDHYVALATQDED